MDWLKNKTVLIFGGSSGIGAATSRMFAKLGTRMVISSLNEKLDQKMIEEIAIYGSEGSAISGDLTEPDFICKAYDFTEKMFGVPDIIISCVGIQEDNLKMGNIPPEIIEKIFKVNTTAPYLALQEGIKRLKKIDKPGKIIITGSICTHYTCTDGIYPVYTASKAALGSLMESTRRQICKDGNKIGLTIVCPGTTNTPLVTRNGGKTRDVFMEPDHVARCIMAAALLPNEVAITDMTMVNVQQDIW